VKNYLRRFIRLIKYFAIVPKEWNLPQKCDILIYDACHSEIFAPYLSCYKVGVFCSRYEYLNIPCVLLSIANSHFWNTNFYQAYLEAYIYATSARIVVTFIDNDSRFYRLSNRIKQIKTVFVQNGFRGLSNDLDGLISLPCYKVDYMFVHGPAIGSYYSQIIAGKVIVSGSFKNNFSAPHVQQNCSGVLFISQWRENIDFQDVYYVERDGTTVYWSQFFQAEFIVLRFLDVWCSLNGKTLHICGIATEQSVDLESKFYRSILSQYESECFFHQRKDEFSSYRLVDSSEIVVTIDSTLGYESLGRGKKTAFFSCRRSMLSNNLIPSFGWPAVLDADGSFWTNSPCTVRFNQIMNYLASVNTRDWTAESRKHASDIIDYDFNNSRFTTLIHHLMS